MNFTIQSIADLSTGASTSKSIRVHALWQHAQDVLVVPLHEDDWSGETAKALKAIDAKWLEQLQAEGSFSGKAGQYFVWYRPNGVKAQRLVLLGLGKKSDKLSSAAHKGILTFLQAMPLPDQQNWGWLAIDNAMVGQSGIISWVTQLAVSNYQIKARFNLAELTDEEVKRNDQRQAQVHTLWVAPQQLAACQRHLAYALALNEGLELTKDLANLPSNYCTPDYLASTAKKLAKHHEGLKVKILNRKDIEKLKMEAFLSVTAGSEAPPKFIILEYKGPGIVDEAPTVLVGKGITFDTGGISLKPAEGMENMKYDMCGAASVLGTIHAAATLKLPKHIVGLIPTCENMPSGAATKPGDVVKTMSGLTVEIINTDAEGRLILCDALTYANRYQPHAVIDIATLTGACVVALGTVHSGLFSNQETLAQALLSAGQSSGDTAWHMPLDDEYQDQLKSGFADMMNVGGRMAGAVTAACYLSRFTKDYHWAHLDIAGTAQLGAGASIAATGRPVPLLLQYLASGVAAADGTVVANNRETGGGVPVPTQTTTRTNTAKSSKTDLKSAVKKPNAVKAAASPSANSAKVTVKATKAPTATVTKAGSGSASTKTTKSGTANKMTK